MPRKKKQSVVINLTPPAGITVPGPVIEKARAAAQQVIDELGALSAVQETLGNLGISVSVDQILAIASTTPAVPGPAPKRAAKKKGLKKGAKKKATASTSAPVTASASAPAAKTTAGRGKRKRTKLTPQKRLKVIDLVKEGKLSGNQIASEVGVSISTVNLVKKAEGLVSKRRGRPAKKG